MVLPTEQKSGGLATPGERQEDQELPGEGTTLGDSGALLAQLGGVTTMVLVGREHLLSDARAAGVCSGRVDLESSVRPSPLEAGTEQRPLSLPCSGRHRC